MNLIQRLFHRGPAPELIIVSGLPRSGTSLMMKMLAAGGLPSLTDGERGADEDNPLGYAEFERVKQLKNGDTTWLAEAEGRAVKVISALLKDLPSGYRYRVILMRRDLDEVLASQAAMLARRGETSQTDDPELARIYQNHLGQVQGWMAEQPNFHFIEVNYNHLLAEPGAEIARLAAFIPRPLEQDAMQAVIDPDLYRQRRPPGAETG